MDAEHCLVHGLHRMPRADRPTEYDLLPEGLEHGPRPGHGRLIASAHDGQRAFHGARHTAADRSIDEPDLSLSKPRGDAARSRGISGRAVD